MLKTMLKVSKRWLSRLCSVRYVEQPLSIGKKSTNIIKLPKLGKRYIQLPHLFLPPTNPSWDNIAIVTCWAGYLETCKSGSEGKEAMLPPHPTIEKWRKEPSLNGLNSSLKSWSGCIIWLAIDVFCLQVFATQPLITSVKQCFATSIKSSKNQNYLTSIEHQCHHSHLKWAIALQRLETLCLNIPKLVVLSWLLVARMRPSG